MRCATGGKTSDAPRYFMAVALEPPPRRGFRDSPVFRRRPFQTIIPGHPGASLHQCHGLNADREQISLSGGTLRSRRIHFSLRQPERLSIFHDLAALHQARHHGVVIVGVLIEPLGKALDLAQL